MVGAKPARRQAADLLEPLLRRLRRVFVDGDSDGDVLDEGGSEWSVICATHNLLKLFRRAKSGAVGLSPRAESTAAPAATCTSTT